MIKNNMPVAYHTSFIIIIISYIPGFLMLYTHTKKEGVRTRMNDILIPPIIMGREDRSCCSHGHSSHELHTEMLEGLKFY